MQQLEGHLLKMKVYDARQYIMGFDGGWLRTASPIQRLACERPARGKAACPQATAEHLHEQKAAFLVNGGG